MCFDGQLAQPRPGDGVGREVGGEVEGGQRRSGEEGEGVAEDVGELSGLGLHLPGDVEGGAEGVGMGEAAGGE